MVPSYPHESFQIFCPNTMRVPWQPVRLLDWESCEMPPCPHNPQSVLTSKRRAR